MSLKEIIDLVDARLRFFFFSEPIFSMLYACGTSVGVGGVGKLLDF